MNKFFKYTLIICGLNLVSVAVFCIPLAMMSEAISGLFVAFGLICVSFLVQFITGLVYVATETKRELGQALLLSVTIFLLIGFSICSS